MKSLIVSADDFGLSKGITDHILETFDHGYVTSASLIANGFAADYAIEEYKKRKGLGISVHLNLVEGKPLSSPGEIPLLVDEKGELFHSFGSLWANAIFRQGKTHKDFIHQTTLEVEAQIKKIREAFPKDHLLGLNGHQHIHLIPYISDILLPLLQKYNLSYFRIVEEPFMFQFKGTVPKNYGVNLQNNYWTNIVKHFLLKVLSKRVRSRLDQMNLRYCQKLIGILFSGMMTEDVIRQAISKLTGASPINNTVEFVFHPGGAAPEEASLWAHRPVLQKYYCSNWREIERMTMKQPNFKSLFESLR